MSDKPSGWISVGPMEVVPPKPSARAIDEIAKHREETEGLLASRQPASNETEPKSASVNRGESVAPHEEKVSIERRPVADGRSATAADLTDKTILAEELLATFDGRLTAAERRIDRILAQLGVE